MKKIFLIILALMCINCYANFAPISITTEEIQFIDSFFNDKINSEKVKFYNDDNLSDEILAQAGENRIYFSSRIDYSNNRDFLRPLLVHELVHVWQWQHKKIKLLFDNERLYDYRLDVNQSFKDYGVEQQAEIIKDYYRLIEYNDVIPQRCTDCAHLTDEEISERLEKLYEEMLDE